MHHKHHIIPRHMGGSDDPSNIVKISVDEHAVAHLKLFEKFGKQEDYIAYRGLTGYATTQEMIKLVCSLAGSIQGKKNAESGHMKTIQKLSPHSENGKRAVELNRKNKTGPFFDRDMHQRAASKGGSIQGKKNAESGLLKKIAEKYWSDVKDGKVERIKRRWINNPTLKISKLILNSETLPEGFNEGRVQKWK